MIEDSKPKFTGRIRRHRTHWLVQVSDHVARWAITIGGLGTIFAVLTVFLFLAWVVLPLFLPAIVVLEHEWPIPSSYSASPLLHWEPNEYRKLIWRLSRSGELLVVRSSDGATVDQKLLWEGSQAQAISRGSYSTVLGMRDGSLRIGRIQSVSDQRESTDLPESVKQLRVGDCEVFESQVIELTQQGEYRVQGIEADFSERLELASEPIELLDHIDLSTPDSLSLDGPLITAVVRGGMLYLLATKKNEITGRLQAQVPANLQLPRSEAPVVLRLLGRGDNLIVGYSDGELTRYDLRTEGSIVKLETVALTSDGDRISAHEMLLGRETLLVGDTAGHVRAWFRVRDADSMAADKVRFTAIHKLADAAAAVTQIAASPRSRLAAVGFADGDLQLFQVATSKRVATIRGQPSAAIDGLRFSPKEDGVYLASATQMRSYDLDPRHPDGSLSAFFRPIWYEGYDRPQHVWQSSFAGVEPEIKLGVWPLVFGTFNATLYSMMFGAPLALLAAIYSSEFTAPLVKMRIKPVIETMASLPSVVLGFVAALVFAPVIETIIPSVIASFATVPMTFVVGATLMQLIPKPLALRMEKYRLFMLACLLFTGVGWGISSGRTVEVVLFAGDMKSWLDGQRGSGMGAFMLLLTPICCVGMAIINATRINPWLIRSTRHLKRPQFALLNLLKVVAEIVAAFGTAYFLASLISLMGFDLRGVVVDTYVQRNAMIVGFAVGFAIIPIIYTIAEDALSTVPQHLRSASLGAGATPWQTAVRVVIPTAMSGLFSAVMIGLGRAVGETMIILMAGGNTPDMTLNPFSGCRTLSANIAVELPEAVRDSTHFRALFFAGFLLFVITFFVNTAAEIIRLRFRRRAYQL